MTAAPLVERLRATLDQPLPLPGAGRTAERHSRLFALGREDLSLARLAEAHWDAVAILQEAGRQPKPGALYAVWASEKPGGALTLTPAGKGFAVAGTKLFLSGAGLVDRVLLTVGSPGSLLFDIDLRANEAAIAYDFCSWQTEAFVETQTATGSFKGALVAAEDQVGESDWYVARPGFWHGACGPAACWAGGAAGLVDYALRQARHDPHTLAHLGAMHADAWALRACLDMAGSEIDRLPYDAGAARIRARTVRHLVEQASTDILRRLPRAYGPAPLAMDREVTRRYHELDLYLRQCHAERDLEALGQDLRQG